MNPFDDIDILDFTREVAGPHCTQLLGALGANVVKVEAPSGDRTRNEWIDAFSSFNLGGKRSLCVDLKSEEGKATIQKLAKKTDVIVENFRPGVMEKFGLDHDSIKKQNESVIYCSISGFGQEGPYRDRAAYDPIVQAMCGVMAKTGYPDRPPVRIGASFIDCGTGLHAAFAIAAALRVRDQTGEGTEIDASLYDTGVSWMAYVIANYCRSNQPPKRTGTGNTVTDRVYLAGDDRPFYIKAETNDQYRRLCEAIDQPSLGTDERFVTRESRAKNDSYLEDELSEAFSSFDRGELVERISGAGVPIGPVRNVKQVVEDDIHAEARDMLTETHDVENGNSLLTAGFPVMINKERPSLGGKPPEKGEHNHEILSEYGYKTSAIESMEESDSLLSE